MWGTIFLHFIGLILPFAVYLAITKQKISDVLLLEAPKVKNIFVAILLGVGIVLFVMGGSILANILSNFIFGTYGQYTSTIDVQPPLWAVLIVGALMPSITEEIWYRGVLYNYYEKFISIGKVALITGLFFALMHGNVTQIIYTFPMGAIWAFCLYYTRSIWIPVVSHLVGNTLGHTMSYNVQASAVADAG